MTTKEQVKAQLTEADRRLTQMIETCKVDKTLLEDLCQSFKSSQVDYAELLQEVEEFMGDLHEHTNQEFEELQEQVKNFQNEFNEKEAKLNSTKAELQKLKEEKQALKDDLISKDSTIEQLKKANLEHEDTIRNLQNNLKENNMKQSESSESYQQLKADFASLQSQCEKLSSENQETQGKLNKAVDAANSLQNEKDELKDQNNEYEDTIEKLKQELMKLQQQNQELQKERNDFSTQSMSLKTQLDELEKQKKQREEFLYNEIEESKNMDSGYDPMNVYDAQIKVEHMFQQLVSDQGDELNKGWSIFFKDYQEYLKQCEVNLRVICALGHENKGKSFIQSQIMRQKLPSGHHVSTKGICVMFSQDKDEPRVCIDIAGMNMPVRKKLLLDKYGKELHQENSDFGLEKMFFNDNSLLEKFQREYVVEHSQIILVVVNKLQKDDQSMIRDIYYNTNLKKKKVYIIHNLKDSVTVEQVKEQIENDIVGVFGAEERKVSAKLGSVWLEKVKTETDEIEIEHVIFAQEGSEAGKKYNKNSVDFLNQAFRTTAHNAKFDLISSFYEFFKSHYKNYYGYYPTYTPKDDCELEKDENGEPKRILLLNNGIDKKADTTSQYFLKPGAYNDLGQINPINAERMLNHKAMILADQEDEQKRQLIVIIEMPGEVDAKSVKATIKRGEEMSNTHLDRAQIEGQILDSTEKKFCERTELARVQDTRKFGPFKVLTSPFNFDGFLVETGPKITTQFAGQLVVYWNLKKLSETPILEGSGDDL